MLPPELLMNLCMAPASPRHARLGGRKLSQYFSQDAALNPRVFPEFCAPANQQQRPTSAPVPKELNTILKTLGIES
jgi:hypothetical protein